MIRLTFFIIFFKHLMGKETFSPFGPLLCHHYCCKTGGCSEIKIDPSTLVCSFIFVHPWLLTERTKLIKRTCRKEVCSRNIECVDTRTVPMYIVSTSKSDNSLQEHKSGLRAIVTEVKTYRSSAIKTKDLKTNIWRSIHELGDRKSTINFIRVFGFRVLWCQSSPSMCSFAELRSDSLEVATLKENLPVPENVLNIESDTTCTQHFAALPPDIIQPLNNTYHPTGETLRVKAPVNTMSYFRPKRLLCVELLMEEGVFCAVYDGVWTDKRHSAIKNIQHLCFHPKIAVLVLTQKHSKKVLFMKQSDKAELQMEISRVHLNVPGYPLFVYPYKQIFIVVLKRKVVITDFSGKLQPEQYTPTTRGNFALVRG